MYNDGKGDGDFHRQSDDDFWNESQIGHNFNETVSSIEYISILKLLINPLFLLLKK